MSGDDHGRQRASQDYITETIETGDEAIPQPITSGLDVLSDSEETSIASRTVQEPNFPQTAGGSDAHAGQARVGQSSRNVTSRNWEDTSDSVPDDLPSVQVSLHEIDQAG